MKSFNYYVLIALLILNLSACKGPCIEGSGNQVSQDRTVDPFTAVEAGGAVKLILQQDSVQQVTIVADDNLQEYIKTSVSGGRLQIKTEKDFCDVGPITVYVNAKSFSGVSLSGTVDVSSKGRINTGDFNLELSGNSKVDLDIVAANFKTSSSGSSEIVLKGQARSHKLELSGAGAIEAFDFVVADYRIESSGAVDCKINVLNTLNVESSGASDIQYRGNPKQVNNDQSGSSSIRKVD